MAEEILEGIQRTDEDSVEGIIKVSMDEKKAIIVYLLLALVLFCAFGAGYLYGQREMGINRDQYYTEYIDEFCTCVDFGYEVGDMNLSLLYK